MFYRSERLFLRPAFPEDAQAYYNGICDAGIVAMLATAPWPYQLDDAHRALTSDAPGVTRFLVTLPGEGGAVIGDFGFNSSNAEPEIGYWIARSHWGRGYATEAGRALCEILRALGHRRVSASHYIDNPSSGRVLRKIGFSETGEIRPTACRARGGELVLARRYALTLDPVSEEEDVAQARAA